MKIELKSLVTGGVMGVLLTLSIGAATGPTETPVFSPGIRFAVRDITHEPDPMREGERAVISLGRHYGKIDQRALDFRLKHETQEVKIVTSLRDAAQFQKDDLVTLQVVDHYRNSPGTILTTPASSTDRE